MSEKQSYVEALSKIMMLDNQRLDFPAYKDQYGIYEYNGDYQPVYVNIRPSTNAYGIYPLTEDRIVSEKRLKKGVLNDISSEDVIKQELNTFHTLYISNNPSEKIRAKLKIIEKVEFQ